MLAAALRETARHAQRLELRRAHRVHAGETLRSHAFEHAIAPAKQRARPARWVIKRGSTRNRHQRRGLGKIELGRGLVEITPTSGLDSSQIRAKLHAIEVLFQDLPFAQAALDTQRN